MVPAIAYLVQTLIRIQYLQKQATKSFKTNHNDGM